MRLTQRPHGDAWSHLSLEILHGSQDCSKPFLRNLRASTVVDASDELAVTGGEAIIWVRILGSEKSEWILQQFDQMRVNQDSFCCLCQHWPCAALYFLSCLSVTIGNDSSQSVCGDFRRLGKPMSRGARTPPIPPAAPREAVNGRSADALPSLEKKLPTVQRSEKHRIRQLRYPKWVLPLMRRRIGRST